jgi:ferredoxin-type protein NapF
VSRGPTLAEVHRQDNDGQIGVSKNHERKPSCRWFASRTSPTHPVSEIKALRWIVRFAILAGTIVIVLAGQALRSGLATLPAGLSFTIAVCKLIVTGGLSVTGWLALFVGVVVAFKLRWFCRWMCPLGTCNELSTWLGKKVGLRRPSVPHLGHYLVFATLAGAFAGFPVLLWLDPLALFSSIGQPFSSSPVLLAIGMSGVLTAVGLSFLFPGVWCSRICPLGGFQEVVFVLRRSALGLLARVFAPRRPRPTTTEGQRVELSEGSDIARIGRRGILAAFGTAIWVYVAPRFSSSAAAPLRPPGAAPEDRKFLALCVRCGNCVRACPTGIIQPQLSTGGLFTWLAPRLVFTDNFCDPSCTRCAEACPSGALTPFSTAEKPHVIIGKAVVELDDCLLTAERECGICRSHCPYQAIRLQFNEETYSVQPIVDLARCTGCGACEAVCPTVPRKAIHVERVQTIGKAK